MSFENDFSRQAKEWVSSTQLFFEDYIASSASLSGRCFEALRKSMHPDTRREAVDELLKAALDGTALLPRLIVRHYMKQESGEEEEADSETIVLKTAPETAVTGEFTISNETDVQRDVTLSTTSFRELPDGPEVTPASIALSPDEFVLPPGEEQNVGISVAPSPDFVTGKQYRCRIECSGGLTGTLEVLLIIVEE